MINWQKIRKHKEEWLKEQDNKNLEITTFHDWNEEFKRFTSDKAISVAVLFTKNISPLAFEMLPPVAENLERPVSASPDMD